MSDIEKVNKVEAHRRAELIRMGMVSYARTLETIAEAFAARDWVTLGYGSWDDYAEAEFSEKRLKLSAEARLEAVLALRLTGMSPRSIASALGVGEGTVRRDLAGAPNGAPETSVGPDGKAYAATRSAQPDTPRDIEPDKNGSEIESAQVDDLDLEDIGTDYIKDPAERIAAFAAIAPEYVRPANQPDVPPAPAAPAPLEAWSENEREMLERLRAGQTVVVTLRGAHDNLIRWAESEQLYVRVDRKTPWGNPFELPSDGDRQTVIAKYAEHYLPHKPSLLSKLDTLAGKALGCWCAPEPCHGDVLKEAAER